MCAGSNPAGGTSDVPVGRVAARDVVELTPARVDGAMTEIHFRGVARATHCCQVTERAAARRASVRSRDAGGDATQAMMIMRTVSVTCAPPVAEPAITTIGSPGWAMPDFFTSATATWQSSSMSSAGERTTRSTPHDPRS